MRWRYHRGIPQLPSPLVYGGVYWMLADSGGLLTELDPATGELLGKQRLTRGRTRTTPRPWRATARSTS